jgi:hypothetical protein
MSHVARRTHYAHSAQGAGAGEMRSHMWQHTLASSTQDQHVFSSLN